MFSLRSVGSEENRRIIEMLVEVLRAKTLSETQVATVIAAAKKEPSAAKRVYLWHVLFDSQSDSAGEFLEQVFQPTAEEGLLAQFISSLDGLRAGDVPLLTHIYANSASPDVQEAIVDYARRAGSTEQDMQRQMRETPTERQALLNARAMLLTWLVRNGRTDGQKLRALSGLYPGHDSITVGQNLASEVVKEFLDKVESPVIRRQVYELIMSKYGAEWWLSQLFARESEEIQRAALVVFRGYVEKQQAFSGYRVQPAVPLLRDALSRDLSPTVRQEVEGMLEMIRRAAVNATIASYQARVGLTWDPRRGKAYLEAIERTTDRDMSIDREIDHLKEQFGVLPEEAELRKTLETLKQQRHDRIRKLLEKAEDEGPRARTLPLK